MHKNIFGTDGIRGKIGTQFFTSRALTNLGGAIGAWAVASYGTSPTLFLAHDTRISSDYVKAALMAGLIEQGVSIVDAHILPTPAVVQFLQHESTFSIGVVISASHNPYYDNGIKVIKRGGQKISADDEEKITAFFFENNTPCYEALGSVEVIPCAAEVYQQRLQAFFPSNFLEGKRVVLDCAHGALSHIAPAVFKAFGAEVITLSATPTGTNINKECGALYPEKLQEAVLMHKALLGFSFDGDGDRVMAVNAQGELKDGDDIMALLLEHPLYKKSTAVVGTVMSNQALEEYLKGNALEFLRAPVGDKYVLQMMLEHHVLLGAEPSGHVIARDYLNTGDGLFIALRVCEALGITQNWSMKTFSKFPQILINLKVPHRRDLQEPVITAMVHTSKRLLVKGRLLVRYSGTEPLLRIMVEDDNYEHALMIGTTLSTALHKIFNSTL